MATLADIYKNPQWQKAWSDYFSATNPGEETDFGDVIARMGEGGNVTLTAKSNINPATGQPQTLDINQYTDPSRVAQWSPGIAQSWLSSFGNTTTTDTTPPSTPSGGYAQPNANVDLSNIGLTSTPYNAPDLGKTDESQLTSKQLEGLLNSQSPYLTAARARAKAESNARGLLNTSMAGTAGEKAAIESALPIAESNAAYLQRLEEQRRQGILSGALQEQQGRIAQQGYLTQGAISGQLNIQENILNAALAAYDSALKSGLSAQEAEQQLKQAAHQAALDAGLSAQEAEQALNQAMKIEQMQQEGANFRQQVELDSKELINSLNLSTEEKNTAVSALSNAGEVFITEFNNIQRDSTITDKDTAIRSLMAVYQIEIDTIMGIYGGEINLSDYPLYGSYTEPPAPPPPEEPPTNYGS
jgi:hypothetical protein